ncbi:MAG TPA: DUF2971 domain-containing protein [Frateuria sp.]|uniref:DUF2971 domain-containing protein n=1 Tax=Frateuria sp. TaxID=2211372 RepID=UPI002DF4F5A4|nr:DUF2971 domain-containing protein [Frateuria sp.]
MNVWQMLYPMWEDLGTEDDYPKKRPLLAHYTSISNVELIFKSREFWLSNPLVMNDTEELRWGLQHSLMGIEHHPSLRRLLGAETHERLLSLYRRAFDLFDGHHAFDTYVGSFSEHQEEDGDGLLSMWRGYGGNGSGAAILLDTQALSPPEGMSPVILARVHYGRPEERIAWINGKLDQLCALINGKVQDLISGLDQVAGMLFNRFLLMSLFSKHHGFREEKEWRVVYSSYLDDESLLKQRLWYLVGPNGVQPKFRLPLAGLPEMGGEAKIDDLVSRVLLGPTSSSLMSMAAVRRMLTCLGQEGLADRVAASEIPFRG